MITKKYDKHGKVVWEVLIVYQDDRERIVCDTEEEAIKYENQYYNPCGRTINPQITDMTVPPTLTMDHDGKIKTSRSVEQHVKETIEASQMQPGISYRLNISVEPISVNYLGAGI